MEYITTRARLEEVGTALGSMIDGDYGYFLARAAATERGQPQLMLTWTFSRNTPMGYQAGAEVVYPIASFEWQDFLNDIPTYCVEPPQVYVVDGAKFTAPI